MSRSSNLLSAFLGEPAESLLEAKPFANWVWEREEYLDFDSFDYTAPGKPVALISDSTDRTGTIFVYRHDAVELAPYRLEIEMGRR